MENRSASSLSCPICGQGVIGDIAYDERGTPAPKQAADAREVLSFSCGHEVAAHTLAEARRDDPNVERRTTEETVPPVEAQGGNP